MSVLPNTVTVKNEIIGLNHSMVEAPDNNVWFCSTFLVFLNFPLNYMEKDQQVYGFHLCLPDQKASNKISYLWESY